MDRKRFLGTLIALPAGIFLVHCGSSDTASGTGASGAANADPSKPAAAPSESNGQIVYTSSTDAGHSHTFELDDSALATPPAAGVSGSSSNVGSHVHSVTIAQAQLIQISQGETLQVTAGAAAGHTHVFTFVKIA